MLKKRFTKFIPMKLREINQVRSRFFLLKYVPKNSICAEIGVNRGNFSKSILKIAKPKKLYLIDPWASTKNQDLMDKNYKITMKRLEGKVKDGQVIIKKGSSLDILNEFEDSFFDWVYVDGDHRYQFVKKDLKLCLSKVKKNGFITGDDYNHKGGPLKKEVANAVDDFIDENDIETIQFKNEQFILKKI